MATAKARAPAGTHRVVRAFLHEMAAIPDTRQKDVERAALAMIRETRAARRARIAKTAPKLRKGPHVAHRPTHARGQDTKRTE
jgi:hypothetical protein